MIIEELLIKIGNILDYILDFINIPDMPYQVKQVLEQLKSAMVGGLNIFGFFVDITYFRICCTLFIALFVCSSIWKFIHWLLKKIPFANMS